MAETFDKNMIDRTSTRPPRRSKAVVWQWSPIFHAENLLDDDASTAIGASTIGSSEAVMLGGLALKWRWKERVGVGERLEDPHPNLVMGSNVQVVWEKFCRYFEVEPRYLPMAPDRYVITPSRWSRPSTRTPSGGRDSGHHLHR